jgi:broad specificity phosphatase PhoE
MKLEHENIEHVEHLVGMEEIRKDILSRPIRVKVYSLDNPAAPSPTDADDKNVKIVHFVRHGQGFHNLMADVYRTSGRTWTSEVQSDENPYTMLELVDSPLTEVGRQQAINLQQTAQTMDPPTQLVVLSPNCRALHTGCLVWEHLLQTDVPFVVHEMVREVHGVHRCDQRRSVSRQAKEFPHVDFSLMKVDEDTMWRPDYRETKPEVADRIYKFLEWLCEQEQQYVGVASHSAWLLTLFNGCLDCQDDDPEKLLDWFETGELRSVVLEFCDNKDESNS